MSQALTESFCERCGTRYEFKAPSRVSPLRRTRGVVSGLRHFVMSQDPLGESLDNALRSEEERLAVAQYDAFHTSFTFCFGCRQYACASCWNDGGGRCLSCVPLGVAPDPLTAVGLRSLSAPATDEHASLATAEPMTWPTSDVRVAAAPTDAPADHEWPAEEALGSPEATAFEAGPSAARPSHVDAESEPLFELETVAEASASPEPAAEPGAMTEEPEPMQVVAEPQPDPLDAEPVPPFELEPVAEASASPEPMRILAEAAPEAASEPLDAGAEPLFELEPVELEAPRLRVLAWDDDAPLATEAPVEELSAAAEMALEAEPEPRVPDVEHTQHVRATVEATPESETQAPDAEMAPAAPVAEVGVAAGPSGAAPGELRELMPDDRLLVAPAAAPGPPDEERVAARHEDSELAARRAQLDVLGLSDPGEGAVTPAAPNVLPYRSRGSAASASEEARLAASGVSIWEVSARQVAVAGAGSGVRSCGGCGLSLSAHARFCRRCGMQQARPA